VIVQPAGTIPTIGATSYTTEPHVADNPSGIIPLDHRVLILHDEAEEKVGSIILPDSERDKQKYAMTNATVVAVGPLAWAEAKHDADKFGIDARFPKPGDRVKVGKYAGDRHKGDDGVEYTILNDEDVIGLLI
jgi:chaperonin GroES